MQQDVKRFDVCELGWTAFFSFCFDKMFHKNTEKAIPTTINDILHRNDFCLDPLQTFRFRHFHQFSLGISKRKSFRRN